MTTKNETRTPQVERPKFLVSIVERGKGKAIINLYNKEGVITILHKMLKL